MKYIKQFVLSLVSAAITWSVVQAAPKGTQVIAGIALQGGSESAAKWLAPSTTTYKVHVFVPKTNTPANALYQVYPKGKRPGSTTCVDTDIKYPCFEVTVNQSLYPNRWVQLKLNGDAATQWSFVKGRGYVTALAGNLSAEQLLNLSALARFEDTAIAIGKTYKGGIIFYVDGTGAHGFIAAPADQSTGAPWSNGSFINTGAIATALGTGQANTDKIVMAQGVGNYAAKLCADLVIGIYGDWFLPSKDELNLMYQNIGPAAPAPLTNIGNFSSSCCYWTSSESSLEGAVEQDFSNGFQVDGTKTNSLYVRAVRAF